jgi:DNA replication ATP-dependent helicase Dna2
MQPKEASSSSNDSTTENAAIPLQEDKAEYLKRLRKLVRDEAQAEQTRLDRIWSKPIPERVAQGFAIEGLEVSGSSSEGDIVLRCAQNRSRFREGDILCFNRGDPRKQPNVLVTLDEDREHELIVSPQDAGIPWTDVLEEKQGWLLDQGYLDLSQFVLHALNEIGDTTIGREHILPLLMGLQKPTLDSARIERGLAYGETAELNWSQSEALAHAYATDSLYLIQGPPGTGKTRVLALLAEILAEEGERVFITAFTHRAINNALNMLAKTAPLTSVAKIGHPKQSVDLKVENYGSFVSSPLAEMSGGYIIGATPFAARSKRLAGIEFDTVLVDEASQMTLQLAIMAMLSGRKYIFVGDHHQLPPVLVSHSSAEAFRFSVFGDLVDRGFDTMLRETYRLNADLVRWPNRHFYENQLVPVDWVAERKIYYPKSPERFRFPLSPKRSKVFIDLGHRNTTTRSASEASMIADLVEVLLNCGLPPSEIGIVTPYRAQAREIRSLLRRVPQHGDLLRGIVVDTVERMQGQERDLILLSLTTSNPAFAIGLADFFFQPQRLNVAVTRARTKLIIVGSTHLFEIKTEDPELRASLSLLEDLVQGCDYWVPAAEA